MANMIEVRWRNFLENRKKKKEEMERIAKEFAENDAKIEKAWYYDPMVAELEKQTSDMLLKLCPINNQEKCFSKCAHFSCGSVRVIESQYNFTSNRYEVVSPRCKLWCPNE